MYLKITVIEERIQNGSRRVELGHDAQPVGNEHINSSVSRRNLWLPDGSRNYKSQYEEDLIETKDGRFTLSEALIIYGKYGKHVG